MNSRYHLSNETVKHGYSNHAYDELMLTGKEFLFYENFKLNLDRLDCRGSHLQSGVHRCRPRSEPGGSDQRSRPSSMTLENKTNFIIQILKED